MSAQREHVGDTFSLHPVQYLARPVGGVGAREMSHRLDVVVPLDSRHQLERLLSRANAIRDRHPVGRVARQRGDGAFEDLDLVLVARRHELERDRRPAPIQHVGDAHLVWELYLGTRESPTRRVTRWASRYSSKASTGRRLAPIRSRNWATVTEPPAATISFTIATADSYASLANATSSLTRTISPLCANARTSSSPAWLSCIASG